MFDKYISAVSDTEAIKYTGFVRRVQGNLIEAEGPQAVVGELCRISIGNGAREIDAEVVAIQGQSTHLMAYSDMFGIENGCRVTATGEQMTVTVSPQILGRILDSHGRPMDGKGGIGSPVYRSVMSAPISPMDRTLIDKRLITGVRSIDSLVPIGMGQRMGIFAGAGYGKSTLLGMVARNTEADVNVIALIGERGMEVPKFIKNELGEEGMKRSVVIVSTSDTSAVSRVRGAFTAMAIAEYFRDQGKNVLLLFDSITRFAMAQREIGLSIGEAPASRGYPPSLLTILPKLLERCGSTQKGTITGLFTILVEGDDMDEPVADAVRGILDGHIILSKKLAHKNHYPAIDVLASVSRVAGDITTPRIKEITAQIRRVMAIYAENEDAISVGVYVQGSNPEVDDAIRRMQAINTFLKQRIEDHIDFEDTLKSAAAIVDEILTKEELEDEAVSVFA